MSLRGQWISRYSGSNIGTVVVDLDEFEDHFAGTAVAWDDNVAHPHSLVRIRTTSKSDIQHLRGVPVIPLGRNGNFLQPNDLQLFIANGVTMPTSADIDLQLSGSILSMQWKSSIGTSGAATATATKTQAELPSELKPIAVRGWEGFKRRVNALEPKRYIFRGQESNIWRLRTSFHRTGRADLERYSVQDTQDLNKTFSALIQHVFNLGDPNQYAAFIHLAQHHGYPTPLLDWTWSPYVAAFFALRNIRKGETGRKKVRIFKLDSVEWNHLPRADKIFAFPPNASIINPLAFGNSRAVPQQSISVVSNVDDIEKSYRKCRARARQEIS